MTTKTDWKQVAETVLLNRKIVEVRYMTDDEAEEMLWDSRPVAFKLDNGIWLYPSADDEGNNGGAMFTTGDVSVLPVLYRGY